MTPRVEIVQLDAAALRGLADGDLAAADADLAGAAHALPRRPRLPAACGRIRAVQVVEDPAERRLGHRHRLGPRAPARRRPGRLPRAAGRDRAWSRSATRSTRSTGGRATPGPRCGRCSTGPRREPGVTHLPRHRSPRTTSPRRDLVLVRTGFVAVGEQEDDEDGLEIVYEVPVGGRPGADPPRLVRRARPRSRHRHPDARRRAGALVAGTGRPRCWPSAPSRRATGTPSC